MEGVFGVFHASHGKINIYLTVQVLKWSVEIHVDMVDFTAFKALVTNIKLTLDQAMWAFLALLECLQELLHAFVCYSTFFFFSCLTRAVYSKALCY